MHEIDRNPGYYPTLTGMSPRSSRVSSGKHLHDIPIDFVRLLRENRYVPHIVVVHVGAADLCGFKIDKLRHWIHAMLYLLKDTLNTPQFDLQAFKGFFVSLILLEILQESARSLPGQKFIEQNNCEYNDNVQYAYCST